MPHGPSTRSVKRRTPATALLLAATTAALSACGGQSGLFRSEGGSPNCQIHQNALPDTRYTGGVNGDTQSILTMMGYYAAHGLQPFCDGHPATQTDQAWTSLYTRLGGDPAHVKR